MNIPSYGNSLPGTVLDSASQPSAVMRVPGAKVELQAQTDATYTTIATDTTDNKGTFSFPNVADGSYSLYTSAHRYRSNRTPATISGGMPDSIEIRLASIPLGTLQGRYLQNAKNG